MKLLKYHLIFVVNNVSMHKRIDYQKIARIIGWSLIAMSIGVFAEFVRSKLIDWKNPEQTLSNIQNSLELFNASIMAWLLVILLDIILAIAFYILLGPINQLYSNLMVSFRLIYVAIKAFSIIFLLMAKDICLLFVEIGSDKIQLDVNTQLMQFLKIHQIGFGVGLFIFGFHLIFLTILLFKVEGIPKLLKWLLLIAGVGYSINSLVSLFFSNFDLLINIIIAVFVIPMTIGELALGIWLLVKRKSLSLIFKAN